MPMMPRIYVRWGLWAKALTLQEDAQSASALSRACGWGLVSMECRFVLSWHPYNASRSHFEGKVPVFSSLHAVLASCSCLLSGTYGARSVKTKEKPLVLALCQPLEHVSSTCGNSQPCVV
ncbi:hypothetical protein H1C71_027596 [Ictidomys tridecemlineatus]|nr:hypothetical protein H1C71_027596 [Ictidomys tridecemlineatus]KAG3257849.1 hypothetical protein H1C71_027596 [Ictidomys tridecemlineatus]